MNTAKHGSTDSRMFFHNKEHGHKCILYKYFGERLTKRLYYTPDSHILFPLTEFCIMIRHIALEETHHILTV